MTNKPVVSVVVPVYQQQAFVAEAIESLLAQTLPDIEIIAVDDGSTDNGPAIIEALHDPRLTLLRRVNGGPSAATNDGVLRARGKYVALLGGDDVAEPWRLAHQVEIAENRGADVVFSLPTLIDEKGRTLSDEVMPVFFDVGPLPDSAAVFRRLLLTGNFLCAPTALFRRDLVEEIGLFRTELIQLQDYDYWLRTAAFGKTFALMQRRVTRYRRHNENLSRPARDDAVSGEFLSSVYRALSQSPGEMIAKAFPELMPPGRTSALPIDRAIVAMSHPYSQALGNALMLHALMSNQTEIRTDGVSMDRLGILCMNVSKPKEYILTTNIDRTEELAAIKRMYLGPIPRRARTAQ